MVVIVETIELAQVGKAERVCATKYCRNIVRCRGRKCSTCVSREATKRNPMRRCYRNLKSNAKRRGKEFTLTFEQFAEFAVRTDYINKRGITPDGYTIDRKDNTKGYTIDNIRVLTNKQNLQKYLNIDRYWDGRQMSFYTSLIDLLAFSQPDASCPF